jgi:hypothetical protein
MRAVNRVALIWLLAGFPNAMAHDTHGDRRCWDRKTTKQSREPVPPRSKQNTHRALSFATGCASARRELVAVSAPVLCRPLRGEANTS